MIATRAGWLEKHEVTEVWFDPTVLPFEKLLAHAERTDCARALWVTTDAHAKVAPKAQRLHAEPKPDKEPKYYLLLTPWKHVPMTPRQAAVVNARLRPGGPGVSDDAPLSPRQHALFAEVKARPEVAWPVVVGESIDAAFLRVAAVATRTGK